MSTSFDNVLLDPLYSATADGGPEFATAIVRSGPGGVVAQRNINREDYISRYEIEYLELTPTRLRELRTFAVNRQGMARGFRFLPPDDNVINDVVGYQNTSGDIVPIYNTTGLNSRFYLVRHYADPGFAYTRWIVKPSPLDDWIISIAAVNNPNDILASATFPGGYVNTPFPVLLPFRSAVLPIFGVATLYYNLGIINFASPPPAGYRIYVYGFYHLPVTFTDDLQKFQIDEVGISEFKVNLEELLPIELGITPDVALPPFTDTIPPTVPGNFTATVTSSSQINLAWTASTDNEAVAGYEVEIT